MTYAMGTRSQILPTKFYFWMEALQWYFVWNTVSTFQEGKTTLNPNPMASAKSHPITPSETRKEFLA